MDEVVGAAWQLNATMGKSNFRQAVDLSNLLRNVGGNYRFVSYANRWVGPRLKRQDRIIESFVNKHRLGYAAQRPWTSLDLGCGSHPANPFGADTVSGVDIREDIRNNVIRADLTFDPNSICLW